MAPTLSPGRVTATWLVLRSLAKLGGQAVSLETVRFARRSSLRAGGLPVKDGLALAYAGGLIAAGDGQQIGLTALGHEALAQADADDPTPEAVEFLASVLLLADPPAWVAWWQGQPDSLESVMPEPQRRLLDSCGLLPPPSVDDVGRWAWWRALAQVPLPARNEARRKIIGDAGEFLSVEYEKRRLRTEGFDQLADQVQWVAQRSDAYGFDILSRAGSLDADRPDAPLAIEVKSSTLPRAARFAFYLSAHEWEVAQHLGDRYIFHFWSSIELGPPPSSRQTEPEVVVAADIAAHLPAPPACGETCSWASAAVHFPRN